MMFDWYEVAAILIAFSGLIVSYRRFELHKIQSKQDQEERIIKLEKEMYHAIDRLDKMSGLQIDMLKDIKQCNRLAGTVETIFKLKRKG